MRWLAVVLGVLLLGASPADAQTTAQPVTLQIGQSVFPLNGPWKFHTGDDPRWADPGFDDSAWERVDLTPKPGAHDGDVGLIGYVPGWGQRGHRNYTGFAWYRLSVAVAATPGTSLALAGPPAVDSAYELYADGRNLGGIGRFDGPSPITYAIRPRLFPLPAPSGDPAAPRVIAFRVWLGPHLTSAPDIGGIRIAPKLGEAEAIAAAVQMQWRQTFLGYVVDATEGLGLLIVAAMAATLMVFDRSNRAYGWLTLALTLTAVARGNQAVIAWTMIEPLRVYDILRNVLLTPLLLAAWTLAWRSWFRLKKPRWEVAAIAALTVLYLVAQLLTRAWLSPPTPHALALATVSVLPWLRAPFLLIYLAVLVRGVMGHGRDAWLAGLTAIAVGIAIFSDELSLVHVKGIWFPYGVGVSRTEYAQAAIMLLVPLMLLRRLFGFAPPRPAPSPVPSRP